MTLLRDIANELLGMFLADARLTCAILLLVALVAVLILYFGMNASIGGAILLIGCLIILVEAVMREARQRRRS